jgi:hypothetical protein
MLSSFTLVHFQLGFPAATSTGGGLTERKARSMPIPEKPM